MQEKIVEIIEYILKTITKHSDMNTDDFQRLSGMLEKKGYSVQEIQLALEWVNRFYGRVQRRIAVGRSIRYLTRSERRLLEPEAYNYLLLLQQLGILSPLQVEEILEQAKSLAMMGRLDVAFLKRLIAHFIAGEEARNFQTDAVIFPGNDRVN